MRPRPALPAALASTYLAVALAGCGAGGPVDLETDDLEPGASQDCAALAAALPRTLADRARVESTGAPGAAYADGVTVRCGMPAPDALNPFSTCQTVNGVDWYVPEEAIEDQSADVVATTISRTPAVELVVPGDLRPPAGALAPLTDAVEEGTRRSGPACR